MSFLNSDRLAELLPKCIDPFRLDRIESGAYELSMGNEYFTTNTESAVKKTLSKGEQFVIEPGQFALLITEETITIPANNLGFISIKAGIKFRGLINVSGFHVDPGFHGKIKFSVYNAGSKNITLSEGQRMFPIWLGEFTSALDGDELYKGKFQNQDSITGDDVSRIEGFVASPAVLNSKIKEVTTSVGALDASFKNLDTLTKWVGGLLVTLLVLIIGKYVFADPNRALEKDFVSNQTSVNIRLHTQDSILSVQKKEINKMDSVLQVLKIAQPK